MLVLDPMMKTVLSGGQHVCIMVAALAAVITSLSAFIWAVRRKP